MTNKKSNIGAFSGKPKENKMFHKNLKMLRKAKQKSQQAVSGELGIKRSTYSGYENGRVEPGIPLLVEIANYFEISLDLLLRDDLTQKDPGKIRKWDNSIRNQDLRVLAITTGKSGRENIELIRENAKAGYLSGYSDPEFIAELPRLSLPGLGPGSYRAFEIKGDSMLPVRSGDLVVGRYVEKAGDLENNRRYVLLTKNEGIVFKRILREKGNPDQLTLLSDNPEYSPYRVHLKEILEAWRYRLSIQRER